MYLDQIPVDHVISVLNAALALDPKAISDLVAARVPCNQALADHPTIQVSTGPYCVGFLGVLNGLFGVDHEGRGPICAIVAKDGTVEKFRRTLGTGG